MKKLIAIFLSAVCLFGFTACNSAPKEQTNAKEENSKMGLEDVEDSGIERVKVTVANMTGKDAVSLLARKSGSEKWSDNILSQDYLHANMAVEVSYNKGKNNVYDLRLVFADGTYEEFLSLDFSDSKNTIYLGDKK